MLTLGSGTRIFVTTAPVDLRGSFNRLSSLVEKVLAQDPLSGHWFAFTNKRRNRIKILVWDGSGLWVLAKRIERGRLSWPQVEDGAVSLRPEELSALLCGLEVTAKAGWYRRLSAAERKWCDSGGLKFRFLPRDFLPSSIAKALLPSSSGASSAGLWIPNPLVQPDVEIDGKRQQMHGLRQGLQARFSQSRPPVILSPDRMSAPAANRAPAPATLGGRCQSNAPKIAR